MFDQLLVVVQCHMAEMIGREEEWEVVQAINSLPLLAYRCNLTANGSLQEPLAEWMRTISVLFNTIMVVKPFSLMKMIFLTCLM